MDRNSLCVTANGHHSLSLSARRAWIEIGRQGPQILRERVALRKESVDRNSSAHSITARHSGSLSARRAWIEMLSAEPIQPCAGPSLSARRAWIEIIRGREYGHTGSVALRKESVDRNEKMAKRLQALRVALRKESVDRNHFRGSCAVVSTSRSPQGERG